MEIKLKVGEWKLSEFVKKAIEEAITDYINTTVAKAVGRLDIDKVARTVVEHLQNRISYDSSRDDGYNDEICKMLDKKVTEMITNIDDEFLKNTIMKRLMQKIE